MGSPILPQYETDRLAELFAGRLWIGHTDAAQALGITPKTLTREGDRGAIFWRQRGKRRAYALSDIADYMARGGQCQSTDLGTRTVHSAPRTGISTSLSRSMGSVVEFTAARARQRRLTRAKRSGKRGNSPSPEGRTTP